MFSNIKETCCAAIVRSDNSFLDHSKTFIMLSCNVHGVYVKRNTRTKYTFSRHVICEVLSKLALPGLAFLFRGGFNGITNLTTLNHCLGSLLKDCIDILRYRLTYFYSVLLNFCQNYFEFTRFSPQIC